MARWDILEHTADVGVRAYGETLGEVLESAALGLQDVALDPSGIEPNLRYELAAEGYDLESLVVNWLNEIVYYLDGKRVALARIEAAVDGFAVKAAAWGEPRQAEKHPTRLVVKAATYHQLGIREENEGWVAEVYLDI